MPAVQVGSVWSQNLLTILPENDAHDSEYCLHDHAGTHTRQDCHDGEFMWPVERDYETDHEVK